MKNEKFKRQQPYKLCIRAAIPAASGRSKPWMTAAGRSKLVLKKNSQQ